MRHFAARVAAACSAAREAWKNNGKAATEPVELTEVLERSSDCVVQIDAVGVLTYLNPAARALLGQKHGVALSRPLNFSDFAAAGTRRQIVSTIMPALTANGVWVGETRLRLGSRRTIPFSLMALAHRSAGGQAERFSAVLRDISEDVKARTHIQRQNDILGALTEALPATVVIVDSEGRYRFVNSAFERYVGRTADQIIGHTAVEVLGAAEVERRRPFMLKAIAGEPVEFTLDYPSEHGTTYLALNCIPLNVDGAIDGFVGISQDVTIQRREQARLANMAERDPLTGLLNRAGLATKAERAPGDSRLHALLYIDLDRFKPINDQFGHQAGDKLLQLFADRLQLVVRSSDVVARIGGDEFAILVKGMVTLESAEAIATKVLMAASSPFHIDGHEIKVGASIGLALVDDEEVGLAALMSRADRLLYRAKATGRGRFLAQAQPGA